MNKRLALALLCLLTTAGFAQGSKEIRTLGREWVEAAFSGHGKLRMNLQSGSVHITGSDDQKVRVRCIGPHAGDVHQARLQFRSTERGGDLRIQGGPHHDFEVEIQIPKVTDLTVRMPAGELNLEGITGSKDVRLLAGEVNIQVGDPEAYDHVQASVWAGEIHGGPFGAGKEGLFRSFRSEGRGQYDLQVRLKAGEVTFRR